MIIQTIMVNKCRHARKGGQGHLILEWFHGAFAEHANLAPELAAEYAEPFLGLMSHLLLAHDEHIDVAVELNLSVDLKLQVTEVGVMRGSMWEGGVWSLSCV